MSWIKINSEADLPKEGKYVFGKHNRGTWSDEDDQKNVNTVVVKLEKGLSMVDREAMKGTEKDYQFRPRTEKCIGTTKMISSGLRSDTYISGDEHGNNTVPWEWNIFGPDSFFGQNITHWMPIPDVE